MEKEGQLTIYLGRDPDFYLELIRLHFKRTLEKDPSRKILNLQAIGQSVQNLVFVACLVELKKYAKLKRITNDAISTRGIDPCSGFETDIKKVRLQVTIEVSDNFLKINNIDEGKKRAHPLSEIGNIPQSQKVSSTTAMNQGKNSSPPKNVFVSSG